ncbi:MAG TPA: phage holin family protein, partial [Ilumatobacteraceae bacterium]|nr:phage holin family protein [Ilumatobacteraceae bacterium]
MTVIIAVALWILAAILGGFTIDRPIDALLAGFVVGVANAVIWPALAFLIVPLSVLTLGLGAIVLNAVFVAWVLELLPGVEIDSFWTSLWIVVGLVIVTTLITTMLALDDNTYFDQRAARQARRRSKSASATDVPGVVFVQFDGVAHAVLRRAIRSGDVPTLHRWLRDGSHHLVAWETGWSSQTGVSQAGILHGSTVDMPAFRWLDKATGAIVVSNHPKFAAAIER